MSKANALADHFLRQASNDEKPQRKKRKELVQSGPINSFRTLFDYKHLPEEESREIEDLLWTHASHEIVAEDQLLRDAEQLQHLTAEIRAISKQGIILLGERIHKAQLILKRYGDGQGAFTQWLVSTFGNRRSAYNMLSYYEFYQILPDQQLKDQLKAMPVQAVYSLASRQGDLDVKFDIVRSYKGQRQKDLLVLIQQRLPLRDADARRAKGDPVPVEGLEKVCQTLETLGAHLDTQHRERIQRVLDRLHRLLVS